MPSPPWRATCTDARCWKLDRAPGTLTEHLLRAGAVVHAIEIDAVAVDHLRTTFAEEIEEQKLVLTEGDALEATWPDKIDAVVSNIPYPPLPSSMRSKSTGSVTVRLTSWSCSFRKNSRSG